MTYNVGDKIEFLPGGCWTGWLVGNTGTVIEEVTGFNSQREWKVLDDVKQDTWWIWEPGTANDTDWPVQLLLQEVPEDMKGMRYLVAVEGHRDFDTYFIDFTPEMLNKHPDLIFKMGELMGLHARYQAEDVAVVMHEKGILR